MINHARTLILNKSDKIAGLTSGVVGAELVDPTFAPLRLPEGLNKVRSVLLPPNYSDYQVNCMLGYAMRLLHMPDLVTYTLLFDKRITYDFESDFVSQLRDKPITTTTVKTDDCDIVLQTIYKSRVKSAQQGNAITWVLTYDTAMGNTMQLRRDDTAEIFTVTPVFTHKVATIVLIPDSLTLRITAPTSVLTGKLCYTVVACELVEANINKWLTSFEHLGMQHNINSLLFEPWEPYVAEGNELQNTWLHSNESLLRTGVFILGYMYQCERIRRSLYSVRD